MQPSHFDIAIVGAGPVGLGLVSLLSRLPLKIALIEAKNPGASVVDRPISLSDSTLNILKSMDVWPLLAPFLHPIIGIHVSEKGHFAISRFFAEDYKKEAFGCVVGFEKLSNILWETCQQYANVTWFCPAKVLRITKQARQHVLTLTEGGQNTITADLTIAADGTHSSIKTLLGMISQQDNPSEAALITQVSVEKPKFGVAFERFLGNSVIALLPMGDNRLGVVWTGDTSFINEINQLKDALFLQTLQSHFGQRLGLFKQAHQRITHPLNTGISQEIFREGVVLIGNASQTLHPIAAQGFNLGLKSAALLAKTVENAHANHLFLGSLDVLEKYSEQFSPFRRKTIQFTETIYTLFRKNNSPFHKTIRRSFLSAMPFIPFVKKKIATLGMGE